MNPFLRICFAGAWLVTGVLCSLPRQLQGAPAIPAHPGKSSQRQLEIIIGSTNFGGASPGDIKKVLYSAAEQLLEYFPERNFPAILVEQSTGSPIAKYRRGPHGELVVGLNVEGRYWAQFAYQFAHEFTHILSNYQRVDAERNANQWFMESLCESASAFVVRKMAVRWRNDPPYPNWRPFAAYLKDYAEDLWTTPERQLPKNMSLGEWFKRHEDELRKNPVNRNMNAVAARGLLSLLAQRPENWRAVGYLNRGKVDNSASFQEFLESWHRAVPNELKGFVQEIADLFAVSLQQPI